MARVLIPGALHRGCIGRGPIYFLERNRGALEFGLIYREPYIIDYDSFTYSIYLYTDHIEKFVCFTLSELSSHSRIFLECFRCSRSNSAR